MKPHFNAKTQRCKDATQIRLSLCTFASLRLRVNWSALLATLFTAVALSSVAQNPRPDAMVLISNGIYRPIFRAATEAKEVSINAFYLDVAPVTVQIGRA